MDNIGEGQGKSRSDCWGFTGTHIPRVLAFSACLGGLGAHQFCGEALSYFFSLFGQQCFEYRGQVLPHARFLTGGWVRLGWHEATTF